MTENSFKLCVITTPLPEIKGMHVLVENLLRILEPLSEEIYLITGNYPQNAIFSPKIHLTNISCDSKKQSMLLRTPKYILTQFKICYHLLKVSDSNEIVIFFVGGTPLLFPMITAKLLRMKGMLIATGSGSETAKKVYNERFFGMGGFIFSHIIAVLERINYNLSDSLVIESYRLIPQLGLQKYKNKIYKGALFVDTKIFKKTMKEQNMIGYIGRFSEEKGIMNFVEAIPRILRERGDLEFLIGGNGALFDEMVNELKNNGSYDAVELVEWIPHDKLPYYLNELKLLVLPSYTEGLPNVVLEAMSCDTPVLATPVGGIIDVIKDEKTGFIMNDNSPECIAENVIRALEYPNLDEIAKNARALVEQEFTYEAAVERYRKILKKHLRM